MTDPQDPGLLQALVIAAVGIVMAVVKYLLCLSFIVDFFVDLGSQLEVKNLVMRECMSVIIGFGTWFYIIVNITIICCLAYPIIFIIFRHKYAESSTSSQVLDEQIIQ
jgi:hypothetical protein